jgi:ribosomal protein S27AE
MIATGAAGQLWAGRRCPVAARAAERGKQIDVVSNQYGVAAGIWTLQRNGRWREMNETCDRCGPAVGAAYRVDRVNRVGELYLCGHCASWQWRALSAQGWTLWPLGVHALAPQASASSGDSPVQEAA